jgi:hypothetical protein
MPQVLLAANLAGCTPHASKSIFYETTKIGTGPS